MHLGLIKYQLSDHFDDSADAVVFEGDALDLLKDVPDESIQLVITSPPYNLGKPYERRALLSSYLANQADVLDELVRVLAPNGSVCWQVGNFIHNGEVYPLDIEYYPLFKDRGFQLRNRVIWTFGHGLHATRRFSGRYETLLWFTKSKDYVFNLDPVRVDSKYPGKTHYKGAKRGLPSGNTLGKNPSDMWAFLSQEWDSGVWDIPNVKANHPEKTSHPCQFPVELVLRCVLALSNPGDRVLDPFCGSGSSLLAALIAGRRGLGSDAEHSYCILARQRIADLEAGKLRIRPVGKPIHQPSGRERVARRPGRDFLRG